MKQKEIKEKQTGRGIRCINSLDEEGLLSGHAGLRHQKPCMEMGLGCAAVSLLCLLVSVVYLNRSGQDADPNLLTRQNSETATTLVITLEDGSVVYLAGNTSLKFPEHFSPDRAGSELAGKRPVRVAGNRARHFAHPSCA